MRDGGFRHIAVVEGDRLVGIVSPTDIMRAVAAADHPDPQTGVPR